MIQKNKAVIGVGNGCKSVVGELCVTGKTALGRGQVRGHLEEVREKAGRYLGEADPGRGNSLCKGPVAEMCLMSLETSGVGPVTGGRERGEEVEGNEGREATGAECAGSHGLGKDLGFHSE